MHFPRDDNFVGKRGYDADYFKQLIAEHRVMKTAGGIVYQAWEPIVPKSRNEALDLAVYNLACVQSCVGKNPEKFWTQRHGLLTSDASTSKPKRKRRVTAQKEMDIWQ